MATRTIRKDAGQFLYESGLLFEINRRVLHPLGMALMLEWDELAGEYVLTNSLWDNSDHPHGLRFDDATLLMGEEKLWQFMEEFGVGKMQERQRELGFVVQKSDIIRNSENM